MNPIRMSKIEAAMRLVLEFRDAFNNHDVDGMSALMSEDCIFESIDPSPDGEVHAGVDAVAEYWQAYFTISPQVTLEVEELFGIRDRCILRWKHIFEESQNRYLRGVDIFRVKDGLISEQLSYGKG